MAISKARLILCSLVFLAGAGVAGGVAGGNGEQAGQGEPAGSQDSVTVAEYCEKFARAYCEKNAIDYTEILTKTEKKPELMRWLSNAFQPHDSEFVSGYDCHFLAKEQEGRTHRVSVGVFLARTRHFAQHTKWEKLQIIPVEHVVDESSGRAGYAVFKYLKKP